MYKKFIFNLNYMYKIHRAKMQAVEIIKNYSRQNII